MPDLAPPAEASDFYFVEATDGETENNYDRDVFNGDLGFIAAIDMEEGVYGPNWAGL